MSGIFSVAARMKHLLSTPAAPPAGQSLLYFKDNALPYCKTPAGDEHPLVENVVTGPPADSPTLSAVGSNTSITLVSDGLVAPSTVLNYYMDGVLVASSRTMIFVVTQETDGSPLDPDAQYDFYVQAVNQFGAGPASATVVGALNLAIDTDQILAIVAAGFVLAGEIKVGNITIHPDTGITIPLASGGEISFPADGSPAIIDAILRTEDLSVNGGLSINGVTNYINGKVYLASGTANPQGLLDINWYSSRYVHRWPLITTSGEEGVSGQARTADGAYWATILHLPTGAEKEFVIYRNDTGARVATVHSDDAVVNFYAVAAIGQRFYVLGLRFNASASANEFIIKVYDTAGVQTNSIFPKNMSGNRVSPVDYWDGAIAADPAGTHVYFARTQSTGRVRWGKYPVNATTGNVTVDPVSEVLSTGLFTTIVRCMWIGTGDFGATRVLFGGYGGSHNVMSCLPDGTWQESESWGSPTSSYPRGLYWNTDTGRFQTMLRDAVSLYVNEYSPAKADRTVYAQYTWYDNNPGGDPPGHKESAPSPINSRSIPKRCFPYYSIPAPPSSGVGEDDPNAVRLYTDTDSVTKLYATFTSGAATTYTAANDVGAGVPPPVGSTFPAASSTGEIASATGVDYFRGTGAFKFGPIRGTGDGKAYVNASDGAKIDGFVPTGSMMMYGPAAAPAGWLLCDGQEILRATPLGALLSDGAGGYLYGNGNGTTTCNVPNLSARHPMGPGTGTPSGDARPLGQMAGQDQRTLTVANLPNHEHAILRRANVGTASGSAQGGGTASSDAATQGTTGAGPTFFWTLPPFTVVNFIIKT